jgi:hypothetical protein
MRSPYRIRGILVRGRWNQAGSYNEQASDLVIRGVQKIGGQSGRRCVADHKRAERLRLVEEGGHLHDCLLHRCVRKISLEPNGCSLIRETVEFVVLARRLPVENVLGVRGHDLADHWQRSGRELQGDSVKSGVEIWVRLNGDGRDNAPASSTSAAECPEDL